MRSDVDGAQNTSIDAGGAKSGGYEPPGLIVLGSVAELTQQGNAPPDELFNDGSQV